MAQEGRGRRRVWWALVVVVLIALAAAYAAREKPPLEVDTLTVARGEVREIIASAAAGEVMPGRRVTVRSEIAGTVVKVQKRRGDRVQGHELVVAFRADELSARLDQAKANKDTADVATQAALTRMEAAKRAKDRAEKLSAGGAISPADLERLDTELRSAEHALDQAKAAARQAVAALRLSDITLDRTEVFAPYSGVIQEVFAEMGVQVAPGAALFDLIDDSDLYVEVPVDEGDAGRIAVNQKVRLEIDPARGINVEGRVRFIPPAVGKSSGGALDPAAALKKDRYLYVEVEPETKDALRIGASVNAEFLVSAKADVVYVPTHAVIGRGVERQVYAVQGGKAVTLKFTAGLTAWDRTEVLRGLEPGTVVIASLNAKGLAEGVKVASRGASTKPAVSAAAAEKRP
ncbi:MAG: efflux RND transporter periplasmic adaptor subunit [Myxococcota bacterium]